jgi:predicted RNase H-like HicB family nuclease/DNA-binding XRE family transcriptional regulator
MEIGEREMGKTILIGISKAGNAYGAHAPEFPGCVATGKTAGEAKQNLIKSLAAHIKGMMEDGEHIPESDDFYAIVAVPLDKGKIRGEYLRSYRKKFGMTQAELAETLGVTKESISEWERNRRDLPGTVKFALAAESV